MSPIEAAAAQAHPRGRLERQYSVASRQTVETLESMEAEVLLMEQQLEEATKVLQTQPPDQWQPQMRNDLAQLHGNANRLLATKIDAILTGGSSSCRAPAVAAPYSACG